MPSKENRRYWPTRWQIPLGPPLSPTSARPTRPGRPSPRSIVTPGGGRRAPAQGERRASGAGHGPPRDAAAGLARGAIAAAPHRVAVAEKFPAGSPPVVHVEALTWGSPRRRPGGRKARRCTLINPGG